MDASDHDFMESEGEKLKKWKMFFQKETALLLRTKVYEISNVMPPHQ